MAYSKQTWVNGAGGGTPRSAARLNHQEDGIKEASDRLDTVEAALDDKQDVSVKPWPPVDLTDATTIATNAALGTHFRCSLGGNRTLGAPSNPTDGQVCVWELTASSTDRTVTLASGTGGFAFGGDVTEVPTISSGTTTYVQAVYRQSAAQWRVIGVVSGY